MALGDKVFALGDKSSERAAVVDEFNLNDQTWSKSQIPMKQGRGWHSVTTLPKSMLPLFGC